MDKILRNAENYQKRLKYVISHKMSLRSVYVVIHGKDKLVTSGLIPTNCIDALRKDLEKDNKSLYVVGKKYGY